jgi:hypothetical protein
MYEFSSNENRRQKEKRLTRWLVNINSSNTMKQAQQHQDCRNENVLIVSHLANLVWAEQ